MTDEKIKHLEMIQRIITRMNTNSFQIKAFTITVLSALLALYARSNNQHYVLVGIASTCIFWALDAFYLQQERKFRGLYNDAISDTPTHLIRNFSMPLHLYQGDKYTYFRSLASRTLLGFYLMITLCLITLLLTTNPLPHQ